MQNQTFRASTQKWISVIFPLVILIAIGVYLLQQGISPYCLAVFVILALGNLYLTWQNRIKITDEYIFFHTGFNSKEQIPWTDMMMVQRIQQGNKVDVVEIATEQKSVQIDLRPFDAEKIWQEIQAFVPSSALDEEAYKKLPSYQNWLEEKEHLISNTHQPFKAGYPLSMKIMMFAIWFAFITIGLAILIGLDIKWLWAWLFYILLVIGVGLAFVESLVVSVKMTSETVKLTNLWGHKEIDWADIHTIENRGRRRLVFLGKNQELRLMKGHLWRGEDRDAMQKMIYAQIEHRKIEVVG